MLSPVSTDPNPSKSSGDFQGNPSYFIINNLISIDFYEIKKNGLVLDAVVFHSKYSESKEEELYII